MILECQDIWTGSQVSPLLMKVPNDPAALPTQHWKLLSILSCLKFNNTQKLSVFS